MSATAFVATDQQPDAVVYYRMFPSEPIQPSGFLDVDHVVPINSINAFKLFTAVAKRRPKSVLTVSHGTGGGLAIPLVSPTAGKPLGATEIGVLNRCADGTLPEAKAAEALEINTTDVFALKQAILSVRRLRIHKLVLRSCLVGNTETLEALRHLFGAKSSCGSGVLELFGRIDPDGPAGQKEFAKFIESGTVIVEGSAPHRFAWTASALFEQFTVKAESRRAVAEWIARHFPKGKYPGHGPIAIHGQVVADHLVFPLDSEYRNQLKVVGISN